MRKFLIQVQRGWLVCFAVILSMAGYVWADEHAGAMPLLAAPINATWAANHGAQWRQKGIRGFLFQGLIDDLALFPSEQEWLAESYPFAAMSGATEDTSPVLSAIPRPYAMSGYTSQLMGRVVPSDHDALVQEVAGAVNRLKAEGIDKNFLHITLGPEAPYFTSPELVEFAVQRFRLAGEMCAKAGLHGIAVETQASNALYDYRWEGYAPGLEDATLEAGARRFAVRLFRAYLQAHPSGTLLLLGARPEKNAPLWYAFMEGVLESVGAASDVPIRLVFSDMTDNLSPSFYRRYPEAVARLFRQRLSATAFQRWQGQGGLVFTLEPIHYEGDIPVARYPIEHYRGALHAAALYGTDYVLMAAPQGGWWHIPPDMAAQFEHLKQGGPARVAFAPPVPRSLDVYMPRLYGAQAVPVGAVPFQEGTAEVLHTEKGAALLCWEGVTDELVMPTRRGMVVATDLIDVSHRYFTPREGQITLPALSGPLLLEGLSMRTFALPGALWMQMDTPLYAGITSADIRFGVHNPLAAPLRGTLSLLSDARYALGTTSFPLALAPEKSTTFQRRLQGLSYLGQRPLFTLTLNITAHSPVSRDFSLHIEPEEHYRIHLDGPLVGAPILWRLPNPDTSPLYVLADRRGGVRCYDARSGRQQWLVRLRGTLLHGPVALQDEHGYPYGAVVNPHGRLRIFDEVGNERTLIFPEGDGIQEMASLTNPETDAVHLVVRWSRGPLVCYSVHGHVTWRLKELPDAQHIVTAPSLPGVVIAYAEGGENGEAAANTAGALSQLVAYDHNGDLLWERALPDRADSRPALSVSASTPVLYAVLESGVLVIYDPYDGILIKEIALSNQEPVRHLLLVESGEADARWVVYTGATSLAAMPLGPPDGPREAIAQDAWSIDMRQPMTMAALPDNDGVVVGTAAGAVYAIGLDGRLLWESHESASAITNVTLIQDEQQPQRYHALIASADGAVSGLQIRRDMIVPTYYTQIDRP